MFAEATEELITTASILWKIDRDALHAVIEVESGGKIRVKVNGRSEPIIYFQKHHFYQRLSDARLETAIREGLATSHKETNDNPDTQSGRWRMLKRATEIDRKAAYEATHWGMGQVLGAHWAWLGFTSVDALVKEARSGVHGQMGLMMRYMEKANLLDALRQHDWARFARGYRATDEADRHYQRKLSLAYRRQTKGTRHRLQHEDHGQTCIVAMPVFR